ncbi:hypothetical protein [Methylocapsa sp. S129]|uniref:hypothetical protein n=1 Tax=Methylocapsa sp. S129 TaxID=1641869 RepID=UPI00131A820B|nr:hypothetical protein [Methylocapsa sp. S129]
MLDLIIHRANLPDGRINIDIDVRQGHIAVLQPSLEAEGATEIDASGRLALQIRAPRRNSYLMTRCGSLEWNTARASRRPARPIPSSGKAHA